MKDTPIRRRAIISPCGTYRHWLGRVWDADRSRLVVCMLNPSRADAERDDPTVLALIHFAKFWGYGGLIVINLHDFRSPSPAAMFAAAAAGTVTCTKTNIIHWREAMAHAAKGDNPILVAWGNHATPNDVWRFLAMAGDFAIDLKCLGVTKSGAPIHPAARGKHRVPRNQMPIAWSPAA